jgi:hypothetical protein
MCVCVSICGALIYYIEDCSTETRLKNILVNGLDCLFATAARIFASYEPDVIMLLIISMPQRVAAVICNKGGHCNY